MADLSWFNANEVQPTQFDVLPAGEYEAVIVSSEMKATQAGTGRYLKLELQVLNGEYQNRKIWDNLNIENPNAHAVTIARGTLSAICRSVGVLTPHDSSELHNKPLRIKVKVSPARDGFDESNKIAAYKPRLTGPGPMAVAAPVPAMAGATEGSPW
jgi:hypothetical protein